MVTVARPVRGGVRPSFTWYSNVSGPVKPMFGVYTKLPSAFSVTVPLPGSATGGVSNVNGSPSGSLSFANTPGAATVSGVLCGVLKLSIPGVGGLLTSAITRMTSISRASLCSEQRNLTSCPG